MVTGSSFHDSPAKRMVREQWNTPFLRYLHEKYDIKFRYMGFPGTDLTDVKLWADMIEEVIAFELRCPHGNDERAWVRKIRFNLKKIGIPGIVYFGPFEEVVVLREDYEGQNYEQTKVITLYNLDFCDEITSKISTRKLGDKRWRFEAIRQILRDQQECYKKNGSPSHFIILLTVRNQIGASKIRNLLSGSLFAETKAYCLICERENPIPNENELLIGTHAWALKALIYNTLSNYFAQPNICAFFFPIIKYMGTPIIKENLESPMLQWMLLCRFGELRLIYIKKIFLNTLFL
jgi:hypothetical protein